MNYFWIRIFDYRKEDSLKKYSLLDDFENRKGTLLDEYYICGESMTRDEAKEIVKERSGVSKFAKPRKNDGIYALVMDSDKFFYDRFTKEINDICFECHKPIKGKEKDFPHIKTDSGVKHYFCSWKCKKKTLDRINPYVEGEWQNREGYEDNGGVYGYIYHIYNRSTNMHYIGQTIYMPFFRWQEHAKQGSKGKLEDLVFEVVTEVRVKSQKYLNNIEAWWIKKFIHEYGRENVMNVTVPKITIEDLEKEYEMIIEGQQNLEVIGGE